MANEETVEDSEQSQGSLQSDGESVFKSICHNFPPDTDMHGRDKNKLIIASIICLIFIIAEVVGGYFSNSLAIITDAAHLLTDFSAFMVSLLAIYISSKPRTQAMSFGFYRAEVLGALISVLSIWLITGILVYLAVERILKTDYEIDASLMMYVSLAGIAANITMGVALMYHKEGRKIRFSTKNGSINVRSALIHVLGDLIQSVGVFVASVIIYFKPDLKIADPICTFIFSAIVLYTTIHILKDIIRVLMEGLPKHIDFEEVKNALYSLDGVQNVHSLRIWALNLNRVALSAHIVISKDADITNVLQNASEVVHQKFGTYEVTFQVEEQGNIVCSMCY